MPLLGVNVDHVATVRQARGVGFPDPVEAALLCQEAGADSIVAHLREDRRHIQDEDVIRLKNKLTIRLNLEMSVHPSVVKTALKTSPDGITLVPENRAEKTTESGLDAVGMKDQLKALTARMKEKDINVSFFVDAIKDQIDAAEACGADAVEIHTGPYANTKDKEKSEHQLQKIRDAVEYAQSLGLLAHVGHGLDYVNVGALTNITGITEYNIGFSIISRAIFAGLENAVRSMRDILNGAAEAES